jgi:hypothetical protein
MSIVQISLHKCHVFLFVICRQGIKHVRELDEEAPLLLGLRLIPDSENFILEETVDTVLFHCL